ncbi:MAG: hydantoinase/oxoprolinase N-terminal domain-containing protein, partial [Promethearchaeia archaeon]
MDEGWPLNGFFAPLALFLLRSFGSKAHRRTASQGVGRHHGANSVLAIIVPLDLDDLEPRLRSAYDAGIRAIAIVLMHGYRVTAHEEKIAALA